MSRFLRPEGLSGIAITEITCQIMLQLGRAAVQAVSRTGSHTPVFYVARDPRRAAEALEAALCAGICSAGGIAHVLGVLSSSGLSMVISAENADGGFSLSGGDLSYEKICVRLYSKDGYPMSIEQLNEISSLMPVNAALPLKSHQNCGFIERQTDARKRYLKYLATKLASPFEPRHTQPLRIALDCANGTASYVAETLFRLLGTEVLLMNYSPDGININHECGVQSIEPLIDFVKDYNCDAGFAFDGDGGRCLAVDEAGEVVDGDRMLAILCQDKITQQQERADSEPLFTNRGVAGTVMTNQGFLRYAKSQGFPVHITQPQAQFVLEKMRKLGLAFGGDNSGYLYFHDAPAADGLLTAARIVQVMQRTDTQLSKLADVMEYDPQVAVSVRIPHYWREIWKNSKEISGFIATCAEELGDEGRIDVREHRDDSAIRIMLEGRDFRRINNYAFAIAEVIQSRTKSKPGKNQN